MDRVYQSNAVGTPPAVTPSSGAYPTAGNKSVGQLATVPGPYWFYSITEEIRNAIVAAGLTPDPAHVNQLASAIAKFLPLSGGTMTGNLNMGTAQITTVSAIEMTPAEGAWHGGYIDFHFNGSTDDHTARIIEDAQGVLSLVAVNGVRVNGNSLALKPDFNSLAWIGALPWTAPVDCFVMICVTRASNSSEHGCVTVNGIEVLPFQNVHGMMVGDVTTQFWVKAGDVVSVTRNATFFQGCYCGGRF